MLITLTSDFEIYLFQIQEKVILLTPLKSVGAVKDNPFSRQRSSGNNVGIFYKTFKIDSER